MTESSFAATPSQVYLEYDSTITFYKGQGIKYLDGQIVQLAEQFYLKHDLNSSPFNLLLDCACSGNEPIQLFLWDKWTANSSF